MTGPSWRSGIDRFDQATGMKTHLAGVPSGFTPHALAWDGTRLFASGRQSGGSTFVHAFNASSGALLWQRPGASTAPRSVNGMVVVGEDTAGVAFYRANNGTELARIPGTARGADPVIVEGQLLVGFKAGSLPAGQTAPLSRFTL
jgi:outer membrane protein assembly factor BamB